MSHETDPIPAELAACADRVLTVIDAAAAERAQVWSDHAFNALALDIFQAQYACIEPYRAWCDHELGMRGWQFDHVRRWSDIPALPISAYKQRRIAGHAPAATIVTWESSGTTQADLVSRHELPSLELYETSLIAGVRAALLPDFLATDELVCIQLAPSVGELPHSSLSHMFDVIRHELCRNGGAHATATEPVIVASAWSELSRAAAAGEPVLVLATSFALVHLFDVLTAEGAKPIVLARGSRLLDTGGFKGRTREISRDSLLDDVQRWLGIEPDMCENEYGMSELSSQSWLGTIAFALKRTLPDTGMATPGSRWQVPWMRTRVVDPISLEPVDSGVQGLLVHHDLANVWSCAAIRSEDIGIRRGRSYELVGRAPTAELRGCSLRIEDLWNA
ncbi:MAG: hypothetical protein H7123_05325 [Thermoleophilia bacterium]|nr:hypothetical protein [Thermoleophilia bacterium]